MTNVIHLCPPTHRTVQIVNLNGHVFASAGFPTDVRDPGAPWEWIVETVAHELSCRPDQVSSDEGPDGEDFVTIDGIPVYRVEIKRILC
jgi:hypothetical protein